MLVKPGYGGSGPEKTLVIVNADSPLSLTTANEYVALRKISLNHIVWLHDIPSLTVIDIDTFRNAIWEPIRNFMYEHELADDIDIITYSADFPYAVDFDKDLVPYKINLKPPLSRMASLTGLTYFAHQVEAKNISYLGSHANRYFRFDRSHVGQNSKPWTEIEKQLINDGNQALQKTNFLEAQQAFLKYLDSRPFHAAAWYKLALAYIQQNNVEAALGALQKANDKGYVYVLQIERDKAWDAIRNRTEFIGIIDQMRNNDAGFLPSLGFKHQNYTWNSLFTPYAGMRHNHLDRYYLSTMLAYTGRRGNNLEEIIGYLRSAATSDGTNPRGTVYFMNNSNVRSTTRQPYFIPAVTALKNMAHNAQVVGRNRKEQNGILPVDRDDVIGLMTGSSQYNWADSRSRFLPGAIAESLTSYGAMFANHKQTKLSEFLRYGASGSSGAVAEPYAVQEKFPIPFIHVHYAAGCSLAEAFYQSLSTPYQLLIVGDPLAQPFAHFAKIELDRKNLSDLTGTVPILPKIISAPNHKPDRVEFWIDGQFAKRTKPGEEFQWVTNEISDGYHDLHIIAEEAGAIATRSFAVFPTTIRNSRYDLKIGSVDNKLRLDQTLSIHGKAPQATKLEIYQGTRILKIVLPKNPAWRTTLSGSQFGMGPTKLSVTAVYPDGSVIKSAPLDIMITPPNLLKRRNYPGKGLSGLVAAITDAQSSVHHRIVEFNDGALRLGKALDNLKIQRNFREVRIAGYFKVEESGFYQLDIKTAGTLTVDVDGESMLAPTETKYEKMLFLPMNLEQGWHELALNLSARKVPALNILLAGKTVAKPLSHFSLQHVANTTSSTAAPNH